MPRMQHRHSSEPSRPVPHGSCALGSKSPHSECIQLIRDASDSSGQHDPPCTTCGCIRQSVEVGREDDVITEQSPLLAPRYSGDMETVLVRSPISSPDARSGEWDADTSTNAETKSSWYLFLLTISFGGLQIAWSVELSNGSPYLLALGVSKSLLAFVWIAGPLSGTLVQPYVGIKSDRCRSRFGKRRPFMVVGAAATMASLMVLAWTREIAEGLLGILGLSENREGTRIVIIMVAVLMIYVLDFSINVVQAGIRAFVVDNAPPQQQDSANAWASRILGMGNIIGYLFGYVNLPKYLWFFGNTQFKVLCVIASLAMATTLAISCLSVAEKDPRLEGEPPEQESGVVAFFVSLCTSIRCLPPQVKNVCLVQLAAWVGWFPFLFYITTYVGGLYVDPYFRANPDMSEEEIDNVWESGTRMGTFALLVYASVSFLASVVFPWFVSSSPKDAHPLIQGRFEASCPARRVISTPPKPSKIRTLSAEDYFDLQPASSNAGAGNAPSTQSTNPAVALSSWLPSLKTSSLQIPWLTLKRAWLLSHIMFAMLMWLTIFVRATSVAIILAALVGIPWSITMWVPFALIAAEISERDGTRRGIHFPGQTRDRGLLARGDDVSKGAGMVLGIHNVAIAAPQVLATLVSSVIFKALQKPRGTAGDDSVAWVLRLGGILALIAAWLTRRITEEGEGEETPPKW